VAATRRLNREKGGTTVEVTSGVHLLETTRGSYVYLVLGEEPVLIDTGMPGRADRIIDELRRIGVRPQDIAHILVTHHDVDHVGNAKALQSRTGATLWAPAEDLPYIHKQVRRPGLRRAIGWLVRYDAPTIEHTYEPGQRIGEVEVIPTPGHTPGHVSFRFRDTLFAGDLVTTRRGRLHPAPGILTVDQNALAESLRRVGQLKFDWVCPAHGKPVRRGNLWEALTGRP
jgi:glyoxylase-like metal-dependent hydrolase (beta-lactamase superfamily II)